MADSAGGPEDAVSARPTDPAEIRALVAAPVANTVVWLDELQRYLGPGGLTADDIRALLSADQPIVLIGTLWPSRHEDYRRRPGEGSPIRTPTRESWWIWPTWSRSRSPSAARNKLAHAALRKPTAGWPTVSP